MNKPQIISDTNFKSLKIKKKIINETARVDKSTYINTIKFSLPVGMNIISSKLLKDSLPNFDKIQDRIVKTPGPKIIITTSKAL